MAHMDDLRKLVGHRPLIMVGATVLVLEEGNRLLMIRRSESGAWGVPGGAMEPGETAEETARRELLEETNLEAGELELFGVFSGPELYYRYPNGDQVYNVSIAYLAHEVHGTLKLNDGEHTEFGYFPLGFLPEDISTPIKPILKKLIDRLVRHA
jgi:ADP-ribose pyrophosphatase YjhB (NUDIX family)